MASSIARVLSKLRIPIPVALGGTGVTSVSAAQGVLGIKNENRIINGACNVAQRPACTVTAGLTAYGGPDRYCVTNGGGAGGTIKQDRGTLVYQGITRNCVTQTAIAVLGDMSGGAYWSGIHQRIEGSNAYDLIGKPITVSFIFAASVNGVYTVAIRDAGGTYSYVTTFNHTTGNTPAKYVVTTPAIPANANIPSSNAAGLMVNIGGINGGNFITATLNAWVSGNYLAGGGSIYWGTNLNATISLTELKLVEGTNDTPYPRESIADEIARCQRYYEVGSFFYIGYNVTGSNGGSSVKYAVNKRATATIQQFNDSVYNVSGTVNNGILNQPTTGFLSFRVWTATASGQFHEAWTADAEL